jgi:hypothetical protein
MNTQDQVASRKIRDWLDSRTSARTAWKNVASLATAFGHKRLTISVKKRIINSLREEGIELEPSLDTLGPHDKVRLSFVNGIEPVETELYEPSVYSDRLPNQIITWDVSNIGEEDGAGEWLRCLKLTISGDRQFIWEGSSRRGIIGIVTYSGQIRNKGVIEGWGVYESFSNSVSREQLLMNYATAGRFGTPGIKALQGSAIRLSEQEAEAIADLLGGLLPTKVPCDDPDEDTDAIQWVRHNGLPAEKFTEDAIFLNPLLWKRLGLNQQPEQQVTWPSVGRVDLLCGNTVIEVKKAVTVDIGPSQIERYLGHLAKKMHVSRKGVRGILVQKNDWPAPKVLDRLSDSSFPLELWSVNKDKNGKWRAIRLSR